jgi:hypothetical protein
MASRSAARVTSCARRCRAMGSAPQTHGSCNPCSRFVPHRRSLPSTRVRSLGSTSTCSPVTRYAMRYACAKTSRMSSRPSSGACGRRPRPQETPRARHPHRGSPAKILATAPRPRRWGGHGTERNGVDLTQAIPCGMFPFNIPPRPTRRKALGGVIFCPLNRSPRIHHKACDELAPSPRTLDTRDYRPKGGLRT